MYAISMREFMRNISSYVARVRGGEKFVVTYRHKPVMDILPHGKINNKKWSMKKPAFKIDGIELSKEFIKIRKEERT